MAKAIDPKAQAKKQKKRAIIAGVVFLALLAYQVPKTMKMLNAKAPTAAAASAPAPVSTPAPATPTPGATPVAGAPTTGAAPTGTGADAMVVNADLSPVPLDGQLATLTQFSSKDPFKPQETAAAAPVDSSPPVKGTATTPGTPPASGSFTPGTTGTTGTGGSTSTPTAPAPAPTLGTISINNVSMAVAVKDDFPAAAPLFTLVSLTAKAAKIAIAGGSLANGKTVTLPIGKPITLMNTADGTRYVLLYVGPGDQAAPAATAPTTSTSTTTTPAPATPTPAGR
jgi:hypothetical protein